MTTDTLPEQPQDKLEKVSGEVVPEVKIASIEENALREILQATSRFEMQAKIHAGPYPSPDTLREYEELVPGVAKEMFEVGFSQTRHRMALEERVVTSNIARSNKGLNLGFIIAVMVITLSALLAWLGNTTGAAVLVGVNIVSLAGVFVYGSQSQRRERERKAEKQRDLDK